VFNAKLFKVNIYNQMKFFFKNLKNNLLIRMNIFLNISKDLNVSSVLNNKLLINLKKNLIKQEKIDNI
jgi:hypothetical protein